MFTLYFTQKMLRITILLSALLVAGSAAAQTTLEQYTERVVEYSIELEQSLLNIESQEWELKRSLKEYLPELSLDRTAEVDFRHRDAGRAWSWATRLEARQTIYDGGAVTAQRRKQELEVSISRLTERMTIRAVRLEAEEMYWRLSHATEYLNSMRYYLSIIDTLRGVIGRRYTEGYSAKGDLLQIESRLSDARYQLSAAEEAYDVALHSFNSLCNSPINTPALLAETIITSRPLPQRQETERVIENHPELRIATLEAERGRWNVRSVNSAYMPQINIRAYTTLEPRYPHTATSGLNLGAGAMLSFSSTIFRFGERYNALQSARAAQLELELEIEAVRDAIRLAEGDAWTTLERTHERVVALERSLEIASENLEISTYAYNEGETSILDVMQAQISWLQTYKNYLAAHYDYAMARARYRYVTED